MKTTLALTACLALSLRGQEPPRSFTLRADIDASAATLFRLWSTSDGVRTVFPGADAIVEGRVGGAYTVCFAPHLDPTGDRVGTRGCTILACEPDRLLTFQWRGRPDHPVMNTRPLPTAVTITCTALGESRTRLELTHAGFGHGTAWDEPFRYFQQAWQSVLNGLVDRFATTVRPPAWLADVPRTTVFVVRLQPGKAWIAGKGTREQPAMMNHFLYMMRLVRDGRLLMGGPCGPTDGLGILVVPDQATAERLIAADPAVQAGTFVPVIEAWQTMLPEHVAKYRDNH